MKVFFLGFKAMLSSNIVSEPSEFVSDMLSIIYSRFSRSFYLPKITLQ